MYLNSKEHVPRILSSIAQQYDGVIDSASGDKSDSFENAVVKFLCLKLWLTTEFIENKKDTSGEIIELIHRIQEEKRKKVVSGMLKLLVEINSPIQGSKWTELFNLVEPNQLKFKHLRLTTSIDAYLKYLIQIVSTNQPRNADRESNAVKSLHDLVAMDHFS
ncbi:unnamed protein product, partial [Rotaria sp. Silwood1]